MFGVVGVLPVAGVSFAGVPSLTDAGLLPSAVCSSLKVLLPKVGFKPKPEPGVGGWDGGAFTELACGEVLPADGDTGCGGLPLLLVEGLLANGLGLAGVLALELLLQLLSTLETVTKAPTWLARVELHMQENT